MSPSSAPDLGLLSAIVACQNCRLETFDATSRLDLQTYRVHDVTKITAPSTVRRYGITGRLCAEHWRMLSETASSNATWPPSQNPPSSSDESEPC